MSNTIEITCPTCGHVWHENLADLRKKERVMFRKTNRPPNVVSYRVKCPKDGTFVIVDAIGEARDG
jgi:hypothetical protein